jgi:hypothetical protein
MKGRDEFIGKQFDAAMNKLTEAIAEMETLGLITGDNNFNVFAQLLNLVVITASNRDMAEFFNFVIPFIEKKAATEASAEGSSELPEEIMKLLRGLDGSDPSKLN